MEWALIGVILIGLSIAMVRAARRAIRRDLESLDAIERKLDEQEQEVAALERRLARLIG